MAYTTGQSTMSSISLPPISEIDAHPRNPSPFDRERDVRYSAPHTYPGPLQLPRPPFPPVHAHPSSDMAVRQPWPGPYQTIPARIPLPAGSDHTVPSSRFGHKTKEVKRRTKTGCQTCRKRRIKCDESRPACRNCVKSKRECAGYDPVFQAQEGPSSIRPQPTSSISVTQGPVSSSHVSPSLSTKTASSATTESSYCHSELTARSESGRRMEEHAYDENTHYETATNPIRKAQKRTIDDLCTIEGNKRPNLPPLPSDPPNLDAIKRIYDTAFAPGLDRLLETKWFSTRALPYLTADRAFLAQILAYITLVHNASIGQGATAALASQEARITWALLGLCVRPNTPGSGVTRELQTLKGRLHAISIMLTGDDVPLGAQIVHEDLEDEDATASHSKLQIAQKRRSQEFWRAIGRVISLAYNPNPEKDINAIEESLSQCRASLDNLESRDIVYSIILMRHLGSKWDDGMPHDMTDDKARLAVEQWTTARMLLLTEARGRSTNQVFATICGMALRAWD